MSQKPRKKLRRTPKEANSNLNPLLNALKGGNRAQGDF